MGLRYNIFIDCLFKSLALCLSLSVDQDSRLVSLPLFLVVSIISRSYCGRHLLTSLCLFRLLSSIMYSPLFPSPSQRSLCNCLYSDCLLLDIHSSVAYIAYVQLYIIDHNLIVATLLCPMQGKGRLRTHTVPIKFEIFTTIYQS